MGLDPLCLQAAAAAHCGFMERMSRIFSPSAVTSLAGCAARPQQLPEIGIFLSARQCF